METAENKNWSLSEAFSKANHFRHFIMDLSMIGMAIGAVVATSGVFGLFDPLWGFAKMHISGLPSLLDTPNFLVGAFEQASNGTWFTGIETPMHHGNVAHASHLADVGTTIAQEQADIAAALGVGTSDLDETCTL